MMLSKGRSGESRSTLLWRDMVKLGLILKVNKSKGNLRCEYEEMELIKGGEVQKWRWNRLGTDSRLDNELLFA